MERVADVEFAVLIGGITTSVTKKEYSDLETRRN